MMPVSCLSAATIALPLSPLPIAPAPDETGRNPIALPWQAEVAALETLLRDDAVPAADLLPASGTAKSAPTLLPGPADEAESRNRDVLDRGLVFINARVVPSGEVEFTERLSFLENRAVARFTVDPGGNPVAVTNTVRIRNYAIDQQVKVGMPLGTQLDLRLPLYWRSVDVKIEREGLPTVRNKLDGKAIGNLQVGLSKTLFKDAGWAPDLVLRVQWDTGTGTRRDGNLDFGAYQSVAVGLQGGKYLRPFSIYGLTYYADTFERDGFEPGDSYGFNLGAASSIATGTSAAVSFSHFVNKPPRRDGIRFPGPSQKLSIANVSLNHLTKGGVLLDAISRFGLSETSPDFSFTLAATVRIRGFAGRRTH